MINFIRAILFNITFYGATAVLCFLYLPSLLLPRPIFIKVITSYFQTMYFIERTVLGLKMEVRGLENLPKKGSYIVASKHQSAYETLKLFILFGDPAIVYKRELTLIPLWGWFMLKAQMIPIDRKRWKTAMQSIIENAESVVKEGRPIAIYPQGTRVKVGEQRPYKYGFMKLYTAYDLPIVPVALNTGYFWAKNAFLKKPGTAIIEILPPIEAGKDPAVTFEILQRQIEDRSDELLLEAKKVECLGEIVEQEQ
tara:strand:+ start:98 stop:856 length:759 start_codon:yes stop_codon:yes gene_type:complete